MIIYKNKCKSISLDLFFKHICKIIIFFQKLMSFYWLLKKIDVKSYFLYQIFSNVIRSVWKFESQHIYYITNMRHSHFYQKKMYEFQSLNIPLSFGDWNLTTSTKKTNFALSCMHECLHNHNTNIEKSYQNLIWCF